MAGKSCIMKSFITGTLRQINNWMVKSMRVRWAGHVARMGRRGMHRRFWRENQKETDRQEGLDVGGRIVLK
jgi:hypothetical protein